MSNSIVIATDLSARSDRPTDRAVQLARQLGATLTIVHALDDKSSLSRQKQTERARRELGRITAQLDIPFDTVLEFGSAPEMVADVAQQRGSALIVVGAARYNHVSDYFLGTAVDYLVRDARVPVLVVKERPLAAYDGLIAGTDFSARSKDALFMAMRLFAGLPATLVHAFGSPFAERIGREASLEYGTRRAESAMDEFLAQPDLAPLRGRLDARCIESGPAHAIATVSERYRHPLAVLGSHGWGPLAQAVLGSRASELLTDIPHDILIVRGGIGDNQPSA